MKKIYMVSCLMAMLLGIWSDGFSQICSPTRKVYHARTFPSFAPRVYIEGFPANKPVSYFFQGNPNDVFLGTTDANGNFSFTYNSALGVPFEVCVNRGFNADPALSGCCISRVPTLAPASCTPTLIVNRVINIPPAQPICCLYITATAANQTFVVYDLNGNVVPVTRNSAFDNFEPGDLLCFTYPCDKVPTSLTICTGNIGGGSGGACCPNQIPPQASLPVKLTDFSVKAVSGAVQLNWTTSLEINSKVFDIEKSNDGSNFTKIGEVEASGNSYLKSTYNFSDNSGTNGAAYYRLKILDIDTRYEYSRVIYVNTGKGTGKVTVGPTVFSDYIQIFGISSAELTRANVQVFNLTGQEVQYRVTGANAITLNESAPSGMYILKVKTQSFKILKSK
jgi:hypothetical protein